MSDLHLELPLSPELVLVSPPEVASLARGLLAEPASRLTAAAPRARPSRLGVAVFWAFCVANCAVPFALAALAAG